MIRPLTVFTTIAVLALVGCGRGAKTEATPSFATEVSATPSAPSTSGGGVTGTSPSLPANTSPKPNGTGGNPGGGPQIVYFRIKGNPSCPSNAPGGTFGGTVVLEWQVTGATNVTISIDGPGIYGTYDPTYSHTFSFPCDVPSGSTQKHTYLLKTIGGGSVKEKTIVGEARNNN